MAQTEFLNSWLKQAFIRLIAERTGLRIRKNDQSIFQEVIRKRTQSINLDFPEAYYRLLCADTDDSRAEWRNFIVGITNSESFFFRDKGQFRLLENYILPELIQQRSSAKRLRICSAGCSTGEEPYSIAMLLRQIIPDLADWDISIIGIDINADAITKAQAGTYRPWSFRGVDAATRSRCFIEKGDYYQINRNIKDLVKFRTINLLNDPFETPDTGIQDLDLILCRNVFIYFNESAIKTVLNKFYNALNPLGYLLVGHAELHSQDPSQFQIKVFDESIAYQRPAVGEVPVNSLRYCLQVPPQLTQDAQAEGNEQCAVDFLETQNSEMQRVALNLLRQLPANAKLARLGNRTASELIAQIEQNLQISD